METSWTDVLKIVSGVIAALGGGGFIVAGLSSWLGKVWANRLMAEEKAKYEKELERLAKQLERKNYVSKVRFDAEFAIYRELSFAADNMVRKIFYFYASGDMQVRDAQDIENRCGEACVCYSDFNHALAKNGAFISKEIYESFCDIKKQANELVSWIHLDKMNSLEDGYRKIQAVNEKKAERLFLSYENLREILRSYLSSLDVVNEN